MPSPPPLDTSVIGLFSYCCFVENIILANCLPALIEYTLYENYVDGKVRVWDSAWAGVGDSPYMIGDGSEGGSNPDYTGCTGDTYVDVHVRIQDDGWIFAWFPKTVNRGRIVWWGAEPRLVPVPPTNGTRLGRAIQIIMSAAGIGGFDWTGVVYYDYEYATARYLYIFGHRQPNDADTVTNNYFAMIPSPLSVKDAWLTWIARLKQKPYNQTGSMWCKGSVDGATAYDYNYSLMATFNYCWISGGGTSDGRHPPSWDLKAVLNETNEQHGIKMEKGMVITGGSGSYITRFRQVQAAVVLSE